MEGATAQLQCEDVKQETLAGWLVPLLHELSLSF